MASQWYTTTNFHKLYRMVKTASLHSFYLWLGPVWCMHAQTMREMAENGVLFDGVESNGGVMASQWYITTNFHQLYPMVKTAFLHSF